MPINCRVLPLWSTSWPGVQQHVGEINRRQSCNKAYHSGNDDDYRQAKYSIVQRHVKTEASLEISVYLLIFDFLLSISYFTRVGKVENFFDSARINGRWKRLFNWICLRQTLALFRVVVGGANSPSRA